MTSREPGYALENALVVAFTLSPAAYVGAQFASAMLTEADIGRPSSTSAVGWVFIGPWMAVFAGVGFVVGLVVRAILRRTRLKRRVPLVVFATIAFVPPLVIGFAAAKSGASVVVQNEAVNRPHVVQTTNGIRRLPGLPAQCPARLAATKVCESHSSSRPEPLPSIGGTISCTDGRIALASPSRSSSTSLADFDYIREVLALPLDGGADGRAALALLVRLRATGRRDVLLIYDSTLKVLHEELLLAGGLEDTMWTCGAASGVAQELVVDTGTLARYTLTSLP